MSAPPSSFLSFFLYFFLRKKFNIGPESIFIRALESVCALFMKAHDWHGSPVQGDAPVAASDVHEAASERQTCADRRVLRDGLLMRSDITVWLKGF